MAKRHSISPFVTRTAKKLRRAAKTSGRRASRVLNPATFIQRSRNEASGHKALWHNVSGAGRARVIRQFFGLNDDDKRSLGDVLVSALKGQIGGHR